MASARRGGVQTLTDPPRLSQPELSWVPWVALKAERQDRRLSPRHTIHTLLAGGSDELQQGRRAGRVMWPRRPGRSNNNTVIPCRRRNLSCRLRIVLGCLGSIAWCEGAEVPARYSREVPTTCLRLCQVGLLYLRYATILPLLLYYCEALNSDAGVMRRADGGICVFAVSSAFQSSRCWAGRPL